MFGLRKLRFVDIGTGLSMMIASAGLLAASALHAADPGCAYPSGPAVCNDKIFEDAAAKLKNLNPGCCSPAPASIRLELRVLHHAPPLVDLGAQQLPEAAGALAAESELLAALGASLARFKVPKRIIRVEALPRNAMGKGSLRASPPHTLIEISPIT